MLGHRHERRRRDGLAHRLGGKGETASPDAVQENGSFSPTATPTLITLELPTHRR